MSEGTLRERKRRRTYEDLAAVALELFQANGFDATTVEMICEAADYSASTFFRYFGSKEDAAFHSVQHLFTEFRARLEAVSTEHPAWDVIADALVDACRHLEESSADLGVDQIALWLREPALDRRFRSLSSDWEVAITQAYMVRTGHDAAEDLRARLVGRTMIAAAHAGFELHVTTGARLEDVVRDALDLLRAGFGSEPAPPR